MKVFHGEVSSEYLQKAADIFLPIKHHSYKKMNISNGNIIADIGCGPGVDVAELSKMVGKHGEVFGYDHDHEMLKSAIQNCRQLSTIQQANLIQGSAEKLPFRNGLFDSCRSERLFMHLKQPEQTLLEIKRVTKDNGYVVVVETDWASLSIDTQLPGVERTFSHYRMSHMMNNGYSGRSLYRQFKKCGFSHIEVEVFPIIATDINLFYSLSVQQIVEDQALANHAITEQELTHWRNDLQHAAANDSFYACINVLVVSAQKP